MSISAIGAHSGATQASGIWRSATAIAAPNDTKTAVDVAQEQTGKKATEKTGAAGTSNPFQMLGSDLQALLTQMQAESAGQAQNVAHATPAAGQTQGGPHHHQHHHMDSTNPPDGAQVASQTVSTGTIAG